jgi:hypothetical protein
MKNAVGRDDKDSADSHRLTRMVGPYGWRSTAVETEIPSASLRTGSSAAMKNAAFGMTKRIRDDYSDSGSHSI